MKKRELLSVAFVSSGLLVALWLSLALPATTPVAKAVEAAVQPAQAATILAQVTLTPTKDNTLYESATGSISSGAGSTMFVGKTNNGSTRRGLLAFNLAGKIPTTATLVSVTLRLNMAKTIAGAQAVALHKVTADWGEGTSNAGGSGGGDGTAATNNDATWLHTFFSTNQWQTPGGDFVATASASTSVGSNGVYTWGSTPGLIADVQGWLSNPATNFGWIVIGNEATTPSAKMFNTRESAAATQPQLVIVYETAVTPALKVYLPQIMK